MKKSILISIIVAAVVIVGFGSTYNGLVVKQETVAQSWGQVQAVYQRRLDLIPNLVATVKAYAKHEQDTFIDVAKARSQAAQSLSGANLNNPQQFKKFAASQDALSGALSRLMVVVEKYPNLKANENFLALQNQLEGTENRIAVARERFNDAVQTYDTSIRQFPGNLVSKISGSFSTKPYFKASTQAATAPAVKF